MRSRGFTLLETAAVVAVTAAVGVCAAAGGHGARARARDGGSANNLRQIGAGAAQYAAGNNERIFSYTWKSNIFYKMPGGGVPKIGSSDASAAVWQSIEILQRRTGRAEGEHKFRSSLERTPHLRQIGNVLSDAMDHRLPDPLFVDPNDAHLLKWQADPLAYGPGSGVPYAGGEVPAGYDTMSGWGGEGVRQRWAFTSSYQPTVSAYSPDRSMGKLKAVRPVSQTPHSFATMEVDLSRGRRMTHVRTPGKKVYFFEEFDFEREGSPYFAYDVARVEKLMFDGSVNDLASGDAQRAADPDRPGAGWRQRYVPLDTFPVPLGGLGEQTELDMRFRFTKGGLEGLDYVATPRRD